MSNTAALCTNVGRRLRALDLEEAVAHAKRGDSVLFTGAGFSFGAKNVLPAPDNWIPTARQFAESLARSLILTAQYDLPIISQYYMRKEGELALVNALQQNFSVTQVRPYHETIASIPWRRVYTTNYDNCFEIAALQKSVVWTSITVDAGPTAAAHRCVHINGHINNLNIITLPTQIKLTHSSYSSESFANNPWSQQLRQDLNGAKSVVYIGYSMSDIDISRLLFMSPELKRKTVFVVSPDDDDIVIAPLEDYGSVHRIGIEAFSKIVVEVSNPTGPTDHEYTWLFPFSLPTTPKEPDDKAAIELLTMGTIDDEGMAWAVNAEESTYCVLRDEAFAILKELDNGKRWFLIHSDLGNGKSVLKQQLSQFMSIRGYAVYWDSDFDLNKEADLTELGREPGKVAVFIDESSDRFSVIDGLLRINHPNIAVFVCVRSTLYELGEARYEEYLPRDYIPMDANSLTDADVTAFVRLFNALGLWGSRARDVDTQKESFIKVECQRQIAKLIVSVFEESEIGRRITSAASKTINGKTDVSALIILSFLFSRIGHPPRPTVLSEVLGIDVWALVKTEEFHRAAEFIRFKDGFVTARSSIISSFLLRRALSPENLLWQVEKFVRRLSRIKRDATLHHVFTELQRFAVLEGIIESGRKRELIIGYFQAIKDIGERSALFWLQYAMARLAYGEFKQSALYFENARSLARGNSKDTMEVNNHYARLLLDSRTKSDEYSDYFDAFEMAHGILLHQMNLGSNRHFPYRQAKKYVEFISFRKGRLTDAQIGRFVLACKQVIQAIGHLKGAISRSTEVAECADAMQRAMDIATGTSDGKSGRGI
jgi:SIR2-like domain